MTTSTRTPPTPTPDDDLTTERDLRRSFLDLSGSQVVGGALAAATSALALSFLGVAGTLVGAIVGSLVATIGAAAYSRSLTLAAAQLRVVRPSGRPGDMRPDDLADGVAHATRDAGLTQVTGVTAEPVGRRWVRLATGLVLGVVLALAGITGVELLIGHPVSGSTTSGTSIGQAVSGAQRAETSTPAVAPTSTTSRATSPATRSATSPTTTAGATSTPTQGGAASSATSPAASTGTASPGSQSDAQVGGQ
jgi:hypothetical protein